MAEQDIGQTSVEKPDLGLRSHLLMPVVEGNTLESGHVSGFLAGRLSISSDESDEPRPAIRLS
ncbi:MAG: hypothetical protein HY765_08965 [Rhodomicrobium sp.]|nr:hypothetical protein [Rhodomicrobium sp.]